MQARSGLTAKNGTAMTQGRVQVYTGDGKGKTSAALGLVLRASGHGLRSYVGQFMKGQDYGELTALENEPLITVQQYGKEGCIRKADVTEEHRDQARGGIAEARMAMLSGRFDIVVLDEINVALWFELVPITDVLELLDRRPEDVELVLTGRRAPEELLERADLVTEMKSVRHYYDSGVKARKGIEY